MGAQVALATDTPATEIIPVSSITRIRRSGQFGGVRLVPETRGWLSIRRTISPRRCATTVWGAAAGLR